MTGRADQPAVLNLADYWLFGPVNHLPPPPRLLQHGVSARRGVIGAGYGFQSEPSGQWQRRTIAVAANPTFHCGRSTVRSRYNSPTATPQFAAACGVINDRRTADGTHRSANNRTNKVLEMGPTAGPTATVSGYLITQQGQTPADDSGDQERRGSCLRVIPRSVAPLQVLARKRLATEPRHCRMLHSTEPVAGYVTVDTSTCPRGHSATACAALQHRGHRHLISQFRPALLPRPHLPAWSARHAITQGL